MASHPRRAAAAQKDVNVSAPTVAAKSDAATGSLASAAVLPTTRPATALAASPLSGPTVGQTTGPIFASTSGEPVVEGPRVTKAPIATGEAEPTPTADQAVTAAHKMDSGTTAAAGAGGRKSAASARTSPPPRRPAPNRSPQRHPSAHGPLASRPRRLPRRHSPGPVPAPGCPASRDRRSPRPRSPPHR